MSYEQTSVSSTFPVPYAFSYGNGADSITARATSYRMPTICQGRVEVPFIHTLFNFSKIPSKVAIVTTFRKLGRLRLIELVYILQVTQVLRGGATIAPL